MKVMKKTKTESKGRYPRPSRGRRPIYHQNNCRPRYIQANSDSGITAICSLLFNLVFYGFILVVPPIQRTYSTCLAIYILLAYIQRRYQSDFKLTKAAELYLCKIGHPNSGEQPTLLSAPWRYDQRAYYAATHTITR